VTQPASKKEIQGYVKMAVDGDVDAFGVLYNTFVNRIFRYVFFHVNDKMKAEDITQEVFIKSWQAIRTCRGKEDTFSAWLYRIAHNHIVDTLRKSKQEISLEIIDPVGNTDTETEVEKSLEWQKVISALKTLPEPQRQLIILKFLEGAENDEIGDIMGKRQGAIRALQMRALDNLRQKLSGGI
jgi:RNA polymerase sigma-70 factor (ECF subfamily)